MEHRRELAKVEVLFQKALMGIDDVADIAMECGLSCDIVPMPGTAKLVVISDGVNSRQLFFRSPTRLISHAIVRHVFATLLDWGL